MKNIRHNETKNTADNRSGISNHQIPVPVSKLLSGSVVNKYPVVLDGGRTILFISDRSKETEAIKNYEMRLGNRLMQYSKKTR